MSSDRFARFLPLAGVLAGLLLAGGLTLTYSIPSSETSFEETFAWWKDNRGHPHLGHPTSRPELGERGAAYGRRPLARQAGEYEEVPSAIAAKSSERCDIPLSPGTRSRPRTGRGPERTELVGLVRAHASGVRATW